MQRETPTLFSIIVPVYNVQKYLPACVKSVVEQPGPPDWECILVDDGATDTCASMCDAFAETCPGVIALHQPNAGLAAARNTGLGAAKGTWVLFLDSDDLMAPGALAGLRAMLAAAPGFDWYVGRYRELDDATGILAPPAGLYQNFAPGAFASDDYAARVAKLYDTCHWSVWKYCMRRSFLAAHALTFWPGVLWAEDWPFDLLALKACTRLYFAEVELVYYRKDRPGSLLNAGNLPRRLAGVLAAQRGFARLFATDAAWTPAEQAEVLARAADVFWPVARTAAVRDAAVRRACAPLLARCRPLYDCGSQGGGRAAWTAFRLMLKYGGPRFALWAAALAHRSENHA